MLTPDLLVNTIVEFYLNSRDFNGIPVASLQRTLACSHEELKESLVPLIAGGVVAAVFGNVHPNPHIRALYDQPPERQLELLRNTKALTYCLYPTSATLSGRVDDAKYAGQPFTLMLARGEPQLRTLAFDPAVLEVYRNDPRYHYDTNDISGTISVTSEHYESPEMEERDKVLLQDFGFAYNEALERAVAVYIRYLADLSPEHQQIWHARLLGEDYKLHPDYYRATILGEWPERISLFDAFTEELRTINAMTNAMGLPPLFREEFAERPRGFAFLVRPTTKEFQDFVQLLDKMLSENLNRDFFRDQVPIETETERADGKVVVTQRGTIALLDDWFATRFRAPDRTPLVEAFDMIRRVRQLRQRPAHSIDDIVFDKRLFGEQRQLMVDAYAAIRILRLCLANHPRAKSVTVSEELFRGKIWTY